MCSWGLNFLIKSREKESLKEWLLTTVIINEELSKASQENFCKGLHSHIILYEKLLFLLFFSLVFASFLFVIAHCLVLCFSRPSQFNCWLASSSLILPGKILTTKLNCFFLLTHKLDILLGLINLL